MLLMIDNYDSFTYNLVQYLQALGAEVRVERNDALGELWPRESGTLHSIAQFSGMMAASGLESYAALEDLVAAHPDGLPPELVAVYGQDVRECRRLWDAARARTA